jgi:hypothetical protein
MGVGHEKKTFIAGGMAVFVIVLFEIIDIDQDKRERCAALALGAAPFHRQSVLEGPPVGNVGEPVGARSTLAANLF